MFLCALHSFFQVFEGILYLFTGFFSFFSALKQRTLKESLQVYSGVYPASRSAAAAAAKQQNEGFYQVRIFKFFIIYT